MVDFAQLSFQWDTMYFFSDHMSWLDSEAVDFRHRFGPALPDFDSCFGIAFVFMNQGEIVYVEECPYRYPDYFRKYKRPLYVYTEKPIWIISRERAKFLTFRAAKTFIIIASEEYAEEEAEWIQSLKRRKEPFPEPLIF